MSCPWPKGFIGFGFEKPENCSQNGSENPPHAAHFFWPKIHGVSGINCKVTGIHLSRPAKIYKDGESDDDVGQCSNASHSILHC